MVITGQVSRPKTTGMRIPLTSFTDDTQTTVQTIVNSAIRTLPVTLVAEDGKFAVVEGLHYGQAIVINGQLGLSDGQPAEPVTGKNRTVAER
jgi:hypothetical protein